MSGALRQAAAIAAPAMPSAMPGDGRTGGARPPRHPAERGSSLLAPPRLFLLSGLLLAAELALFVFLAAGTHGWIVPLKTPTSTDFVSFYAAGSLADSGTPRLAYDRAAHYAAEERAAAPGIVYNFFYYPPPYLVVCAALARLPYIPAFVIFEAVGLAFYLFVMRRVLGEPRWAALIPILAFPPVLWTIGLGQNGFLTAGLFAAATLLVDRRPATAGLLFGMLCVKPHFALLVPVALAAGGRWRAFCAAAAAAAGLCLLSLMLFGWHTWQDFLRAALASRQVYASGRIPFTGFVTPFGAAMLLGAPLRVAGIAQGVATLAAGIFVGFVWRRNLPLPVRAASLVSATLAAIPLALFYDLVLAGVAAAWLLRAGNSRLLPEWGRPALAVLYVISLDPRGLAGAWHLPIGTFVAVGLVGLAGAAAIAARRSAAPGAAAANRATAHSRDVRSRYCWMRVDRKPGSP